MSTPSSDTPSDIPSDTPSDIPDDVPEADAQEQAQTLAGQSLPADSPSTAEADEGDLAEQAREVPLADRDEYP